MRKKGLLLLVLGASLMMLSSACKKDSSFNFNETIWMFFVDNGEFNDVNYLYTLKGDSVNGEVWYNNQKRGYFDASYPEIKLVVTHYAETGTYVYTYMGTLSDERNMSGTVQVTLDGEFFMDSTFTAER